MSPNRLSERTIVLVEDHDDLRESMGIFLGRMGVNVVLAKNGFEGLEAVKNCAPDLVVTDLDMPGMDGFEMLRRIRALGPDVGSNLPVIAMTALDTRVQRARILNMGFQACIQKPFTVETLLVTMLSLLSD